MKMLVIGFKPSLRLSDLISTNYHLQTPYFQIRSQAQAPNIRMSAYLLGDTIQLTAEGLTAVGFGVQSWWWTFVSLLEHSSKPYPHHLPPIGASLDQSLRLSGCLFSTLPSSAAWCLAEASLERSSDLTEIGEPFKLGFFFFPSLPNSPHCSCCSLFEGPSHLRPLASPGVGRLVLPGGGLRKVCAFW